MRTLWIALNLGAKLLLAGCVIVALVAPDLPQFEGKGIGIRALTYPVSALVVPLAWRLRGRHAPYPHAVDALVVMPFVVDFGGNVLDLFDTVGHFDEITHAVDWALLVAAFGAALARLPTIGRLNAAALAVGFGATTHLLWELVEYAAFALGYYGLDLTYTDTIGDLAVSFLGTLAGALVTVVLVGPRSGAKA